MKTGSAVLGNKAPQNQPTNELHRNIKSAICYSLLASQTVDGVFCALLSKDFLVGHAEEADLRLQPLALRVFKNVGGGGVWKRVCRLGPLRHDRAHLSQGGILTSFVYQARKKHLS